MGSSVQPQSIEDALAQIRAGAPKPSIDEALAAIRAGAPAETPAKPPTTLDKIEAAAKKAFSFTPAAVTYRAVTHPLETMLNIGQGVPGGEAAQAGFAMLGSRIPGVRGDSGPLSYEDALAAIHDATKDAPLASRLVAKVPGAMVSGSLLPAGAGIGKLAAGGAALAGADRALAAKPESFDDRLREMAKAAVIGGVAAPALSKLLALVTAGADAMGADSPDVNLLAQKQGRDAAAKVNYAKALAEGQGQTDTPAIRAFLMEPDIAPIVQRLQQSREFAGLDPHSPEMLDQVYKELSSTAGDLQRGLVNPNAANGASRRLDLRDTRAAQSDLLTTVDPAMPSYRGAVQDYADRSGELDATQRGVDALRSARAVSMSGKAAASGKSPASTLDWLENAATPSQAERYAEGLSGATKQRLGHEVTSPLSLLRGAPLRTLNAAAKMNPNALDPSLRNSLLAQLLALAGQ